VGSLVEDSLHSRLTPGEAAFPVAELLAVLAEIGGLRSVGVEVFSDELAGLPRAEAGRRAGDSLRALLALVEVP